MRTRALVSLLLLLAVFLAGCAGTEVTGAVVSKMEDDGAYGLRVLEIDGSTEDIRVTWSVYHDVVHAGVYRFWCDKGGPYCRADARLYTPEWADVIDNYIKIHIVE